jgi:hypothetical protein
VAAADLEDTVVRADVELVDDLPQPVIHDMGLWRSELCACA